MSLWPGLYWGDSNLLLGGTSSPAESTILINLISAWDFNADTNDSHGSNNFTVHGNPTYVDGLMVRSNGQYKKAIKFNNSADTYLDQLSNESLQTGDIDFALAAWYKTGTNSQIIICKRDSALSTEYILNWSSVSTLLQFQIAHGADPNCGVVQQTGIGPGELHFIIAWHDSTNDTVNIQVDNGTVQSAATTNTPLATDAKVRIGAGEDGGGAGQGIVNSVLFWKGRFPDADERSLLWNNGFGLVYPFNGSPFASGETGVSYFGKGGTSQENLIFPRYGSLSSIELSGTHYQAITYWDGNNDLAIGIRTLPGGTWVIYTYGSISVAGTDLHDSSSVGFDSNGYVHVAYGMHGIPLLYRKSDASVNSWDGTLTAELDMLGTNENQVTYPMFFNDPDGTLYFMFRDGTADVGDIYFYTYNVSGESWAASSGTSTAGLLIDGGSNTVYHDLPIFESTFGAGGYMHFIFMYRDVAIRGWDYCHVKWDGNVWVQTDGTSQSVPMSQANDYPFETGTTIYNNGSLDLDNNNHPHIVYFKQDGSGYDQLYHADYNGSVWAITKITNTNTLGNYGDIGRPRIFINRTTKIGYIVYRDDADVEGLLLQTSNKNDFTVWTKSQLYPANVGQIEPTYDQQYYESDGIVDFFMSAFFSGTSIKPISVFEWIRP